jgi:tRNA A37 threonylcarbamoyladenosine synthetase subunit TsaC/SUA5/YrdC
VISVNSYFVAEVQSSLLKKGKEIMSTATLPLPLELTQPVELSSSLEDALREAYDVANTKYNSESQVRENTKGIPQIVNGGNSTKENSRSNVKGIIAVDDVQVIIDL